MKATMIVAAATTVVCAGFISTAGIAETQTSQLTPEQKALVVKLRAIDKSLHPQTGDIRIPEADAVLHLGNGYYFLPKDEATNVLENAWGNPHEAVSDVLGMVFREGTHFYNDKAWSAVITSDASGYVPSSEASADDFKRAEKAIRDNEDSNNQERKKANAVPIHFVGWADPPKFDSTKHTLIWARDLKFGNASEDTLNYDVRVLGRRGYLSLNLLSGMPELPNIRTAAEGLRQTVSFDSGSRYEDYRDGVDKKSTFGIAGLVAAGAGVALAQKLGLFAVLLVFLKKGALVIAAVLAAAGARLKSVFSRKGSVPK